MKEKYLNKNSIKILTNKIHRELYIYEKVMHLKIPRGQQNSRIMQIIQNLHDLEIIYLFK